MEIHDGWEHGFVVKGLPLHHGFVEHFTDKIDKLHGMDLEEASRAQTAIRNLAKATEKHLGSRRVSSDASERGLCRDTASLSTPLLGDQAELAKLRRDNMAYKTALADSLKALKALHKVEREKSNDYRQL